MSSLQSIVLFLEASKYVLLFVGSYIEGTAVMLTGGILWRLGQVEFWPAYTALLAGDLLADLMWYGIGFFGARRFMERWGHIVNVTPQVVLRVEKRFHTHHTWILIVSKLTMGFGLAVGTLMTAGMLRIPLWRYIVINGLGGIVWVLVIMVVGYYFGNVLAFVPRELQYALAVVIVVAAFFGLRALNARLARADW